MITDKVDTKMDYHQLEKEMDSFNLEIDNKEVSQWFLREKYVDRGRSDPFYIIKFRHQVDELKHNDSLQTEPLFHVNNAMSTKSMTCLKEGQCQDYWQPASKEELLRRLERFMTMYRENYIQPPGYWGKPFDVTREHTCFKGKRFLFQITSPSRSITGVGPKMYAGSVITGTLRDENEIPMTNQTLILKRGEKEIERQTTSDTGLFRFEGLVAGDYQIKLPGYHMNARTAGSGSIQGKLKDIHWPVEVELIDPDNAVTTTWSDANGAFQFEGLVPRQYKLRSRRLLLSEISSEERLKK